MDELCPLPCPGPVSDRRPRGNFGSREISRARITFWMFPPESEPAALRCRGCGYRTVRATHSPFFDHLPLEDGKGVEPLDSLSFRMSFLHGERRHDASVLRSSECSPFLPDDVGARTVVISCPSNMICPDSMFLNPLIASASSRWPLPRLPQGRRFPPCIRRGTDHPMPNDPVAPDLQVTQLELGPRCTRELHCAETTSWPVMSAAISLEEWSFVWPWNTTLPCRRIATLLERSLTSAACG